MAVEEKIATMEETTIVDEASQEEVQPQPETTEPVKKKKKTLRHLLTMTSRE